jgi:hypothetical protein
VSKRQPEDLTREQLLDIVKAAREALWPSDDAEHTWTPDTLDEVAKALTKYDDAPSAEMDVVRHRRALDERINTFWRH